jgi:hypothetical protein
MLSSYNQMPRQLINDYLKEKEEQLTIWALRGHMYLAIASCILYVNNGYFQFDRVGI